MFCGKCGFENVAESMFCASCGNRLAILTVNISTPSDPMGVIAPQMPSDVQQPLDGRMPEAQFFPEKQPAQGNWSPQSSQLSAARPTFPVNTTKRKLVSGIVLAILSIIMLIVSFNIPEYRQVAWNPLAIYDNNEQVKNSQLYRDAESRYFNRNMTRRVSNAPVVLGIRIIFSVGLFIGILLIVSYYVSEQKQNTQMNSKFHENTQYSQGIIKPKYNTVAFIGFIIACVSLLLNLFGIVGLLAISFSFVGLKQINNAVGRGKGFAVAGITLGGVGVLLGIIQLINISR